MTGLGVQTGFRIGLALCLLVASASVTARIPFLELELLSESGLEKLLDNADKSDQGRIYAMLARSVLDRDPVLALEYMDFAAALLDMSDMAGRAYLHAHSCWIKAYHGEMQSAREACLRGVELADESMDAWAKTKAQGAMAAWYVQTGQMDVALVAGGEAIDAALATGQAHLIANQYNTMGLIERVLGSYRRSLNYFVKGLEALDDGQNRELYYVLSFNLGLSYADLGHHELAQDFYTATLEWMKQTRRHSKVLTATTYIALADIAMGRPLTAVQKLDSALQRSELRENKAVQVLAYAVLGEAYIALGEPQKALQVLGLGTAFDLSPLASEHQRLKLAISRALMMAGELDRASTRLTLLITELRTTNAKELLLAALELFGDLQERAGQYERSLSAFKEAQALKEEFQTQRLEYELASVRAELELDEANVALLQAQHANTIRTGIILLVLALAAMFYLFASRRAQMIRAEVQQRQALQLEHLVAERTDELQQKVAQAAQLEAGRLSLERQLAEAEKLRVLGQLTGGVAHDFNNLLTVIIGSAELLTATLEDEERYANLLNHIMTAANSGADITRALMAYARQQPLELETVSLKDLLVQRLPLIERTLGGMVSLKADLDDAVDMDVVLDAAQLTTALLNLALNARDAQERKGTIWVRLSERGGRWAVISVEDSGKGMSEAEVRRAVEPFYTTKDGLQGNGLGLSMVYGFSKQLEGDLEIESKPGAGTKVRIILPLTDVEVEKKTGHLSLIPPASA